MRNSLKLDESIGVGEMLTSANSRVRLTLQPEGNLVLTRTGTDMRLWSERGAGGTRLILQQHKLVLLRADGQVAWSAGEYYEPLDILQLRDDGILQITTANGHVTWWSERKVTEIYRDRVILDTQFCEQFIMNHPAAGLAIVGAREVSVRGTVSLSGCDLVILADRFDGTQGEIEIRYPAGRQVTILCQELLGATVRCPGERGTTETIEVEPGTAGSIPPPRPRPSLPRRKLDDLGIDDPPIIDDPVPVRPRPTRYKGTDGGDGGSITVLYLKDNVPGGFKAGATLQAPGGAPGASDKQPGKPGTVRHALVSAQELGQAAQSYNQRYWSNYRLRLAEYYLRDRKSSETLAAALTELKGILTFDPTCEEAKELLALMRSDQNILGYPNDYDVFPHFDKYEGDVRAWITPVRQIFDGAKNLFLETANELNRKAELESEKVHQDNLINILQLDELGPAQETLEAVRRENTNNEKLYTDSSARLLELERDNHDIDIGGVLIKSGKFITGIAALATPIGGGVTAVFTGIQAILPGLKQFDTSFQDLKSVDNLLVSSEERDAFTKSAGGLKDLFNQISSGTSTVQGSILSIPKLFDDLTALPAPSPEYNELSKQTIELGHAIELGKVREAKAQQTIAAIKRKIGAAEMERNLTALRIGNVSKSVDFLIAVTQSIISTAQSYLNMVMHSVFFAARAFEIYTLQSANLRLDYGYIHPEREDDLWNDIRHASDDKRGEASRSLLAEYDRSWNSLVGDVLDYKRRFDSYFNRGGDYTGETLLVEVSNPERLSSFRKTGELSFAVELSDLPPTRFEAKVVGVNVDLEGITSRTGLLTLIMEHGGRSTQRLRTGETVNDFLSPRSTVVQFSATPGVVTGIKGNAGPTLRFWRRGIAARWRMYFEDTELATNNINLSGLTTLKIYLTFESFLMNATVVSTVSAIGATLMSTESHAEATSAMYRKVI